MSPFAVLAEPNRRQILDQLARSPACVNDLVTCMGLSQPAVSKHLRILRESEFVRVVPSGQRRVYHVNPAPLREVDKWLAQYRKFWSGKLDALEAHLAKSQA